MKALRHACERLALCFAAASLMAACASPPPMATAQRISQLRDQLREQSAIAQAAQRAQQPATRALRPPAPQAAVDGPAAPTLASAARVDLDFRNAPLAAVLDAISRGSGIDFMLDRDVRTDARVTLHLRDAPAAEAIALLAAGQQLSRQVIDPRTVLLYPNTPDKQREHQQQALRVFHLAHADAKGAASLLRTVLRLKDVYVDERANVLVLREPATMVAIAERLLALHDQPDAEVMLELEVLEVTGSRISDLGLRLPDAISLVPLAPDGALTVDALRGLNGSRIGVGITPLVLNLRRELGDATVLANPRIRARNREKARVLIGDKVPVITSTASATGFVSENVNYLDVGLKLELEPTVSPDGEVTIRLALEVSSIAREVRSATGTLAYQIGTRHATTALRLADGETQILAGLISHEDRSTANRWPGLGELPLAGRLFSSQHDDRRRTELVLAITPRVLRPAPRSTALDATLAIGTEMDTALRTPPARGPVSVDKPEPADRHAPEPAAPQADGLDAKPALYWQSPAGARAGNAFDVVLGLTGAQGLRGATTELAYTAATLDVLDVGDGELMGTAGAAASFTHAVDRASGLIRITQLRGGDAGATGSGSLVRLRLRARSAGPGELRVATWTPLGMPPLASPAPKLILELR